VARIKVLYCIDSVARDAGTEKQLEEWIRRIDPERFEFHLCCFEDSPRLQTLADCCTPIVLPIGSLYRLNALLQIRRLRRYINRNDIHIVHTFFVKSNIVGVLAARRSRCRAIVSSRLNMGYWLTGCQLRVLRHLDKYVTRLLANAERVKEFVVETENVPPEKVDIIYNRVDTKLYRPGCGDPSVPRALGIPDEAKVVGVVANLRPVKDYPLFLRAAKLVAQQVPDAAFLIVGQGELREALGRMAYGLGIADQVFFSDGRGVVADYLGRMDIGCLSSKSEGFSNTLLEYMAAGLPVVATDVGGAREAVEHGASGYVVPHGRPEDFARPIVQLLKDDTKRAAMGREALRRCREKFDLDTTAREFEAYYAGLAEEGLR